MIQFDDCALGHALQVSEGEFSAAQLDTDVDADAIQQSCGDPAAAFWNVAAFQVADVDGYGIGLSFRFCRPFLWRRLVLRWIAWTHETLLVCRYRMGEG